MNEDAGKSMKRKPLKLDLDPRIDLTKPIYEQRVQLDRIEELEAALDLLIRSVEHLKDLEGSANLEIARAALGARQ